MIYVIRYSIFRFGVIFDYFYIDVDYVIMGEIDFCVGRMDFELFYGKMDIGLLFDLF